ncbi:hypothetical protein BURK1_02346 [Burkholderiales bacterium]|nr:hypothetical protein BURK1_02346 [Burkholderiales bacterium]
MDATRPRHRRLAAIVAAVLACGTLAAPALAAPPCYTVYDARGGIVYRGHASPFDGALDPASHGRAAMRARGEHLVFFEADHCVPVARAGGSGGRPLTADDIVADFPGRAPPGTGGVTGAAGGGAPMSAGPSFGGPAARITAPASSAIQTRVGAYR